MYSSKNHMLLLVGGKMAVAVAVLVLVGGKQKHNIQTKRTESVLFLCPS